MKKAALLAAMVLTASARLAGADEHYTLHENLHFGQRVGYVFDQTIKTKSISVTNDKKTVTDTLAGQHWKVAMTVFGVKDGSATREMVVFDPGSYDTTGDNGKEQKIKCPFAGKTINLTRHADESITNSFPSNAIDDDVNSLNSIIIPDEDFYPDSPVAVGDIWDNSAKYSRHMGLGPQDRILSKCRLDWVKTIGGKQMAHITDSVGSIYYEAGNVEEDMTYSMTALVDIAAGMIVKCKTSGSSAYSTPPSEATQVTGGVQFDYHGCVVGYEKYDLSDQ